MYYIFIKNIIYVSLSLLLDKMNWTQRLQRLVRKKHNINANTKSSPQSLLNFNENKWEQVSHNHKDPSFLFMLFCLSIKHNQVLTLILYNQVEYQIYTPSNITNKCEILLNSTEVLLSIKLFAQSLLQGVCKLRASIPIDVENHFSYKVETSQEIS